MAVIMARSADATIGNLQALAETKTPVVIYRTGPVAGTGAGRFAGQILKASGPHHALVGFAILLDEGERGQTWLALPADYDWRIYFN